MTSLRGVACVMLSLLVASVLAGCSSGLSDTGEPLTIEQSEALAQVRFQQAAAGDAALEIAVGDEDDVDHVVAEVTVDFDDLIAWGTVERGPAGISVTETVAFSPELYVVEGDAGWQQSTSPSSMLSIVFALGSDRPENAQLLRQSDASYLGTADDRGEALHVFRMPSAITAEARTRMWINDDGAFQRLDAGDDSTLVIRAADAPPQPRAEMLSEIFGVSDE